VAQGDDDPDQTFIVDVDDCHLDRHFRGFLRAFAGTAAARADRGLTADCRALYAPASMSLPPIWGPSPSLEQFADAFLAGTLPRAQWTHEAHLRIGAWHVHRFGTALALPRLRESIRRLNLAHGGANTATAGYHETITAAYVWLIADFLAGLDANRPLADHVERLLASPLAEKNTLLRFWSRGVLMSTQARADWVPPDLAPLPLPTDPGAR
jgi:hypothetical protein